MDFNQLAKFADANDHLDKDALLAYAKEFGTDWDELQRFEDRYQGEAGNDTDDALYRWYWDNLEETNPEAFEKFSELAQDLCILVDWNDVDRVAVDQDYMNVDGYVFRTH